MDQMVTARELAATLGVHRNWVYAQAASGNLPSYKVGSARRFLPCEVADWLNDRQVTHATPPVRSRQHRPARRGRR
jgi:excisionase family DNA binding protein